MTPNEYQRAAMRTAPQKLSLAEAALGMATEASEAADVLKKHLFQGHPLDKEKLKKEMGDALWYMAYVCHMTEGLDLESVMEDNIAKLAVRFPNGFTPEASMARADENNADTDTIERKQIHPVCSRCGGTDIMAEYYDGKLTTYCNICGELWSGEQVGW